MCQNINPVFYDELNNDGSQFRLLKVADGPINGPHFNLRIFHCADAPEYKALSYTWGSKLDPKTIHVNGRPFVVRQNLHAFLEVCRTLDDRPWIWIDQICINQADEDEKGTQVQMMDAIFGRASETYVWLGTDPDDGVVADLVNQVVPKYRAEVQNQQCEDDHVLVQKHQEYWAAISAALPPNTRDALRRLSLNSYWERLWVAQEVVLSRQPTILYGMSHMNFHDYHTALQQLQPLDEDTEAAGLSDLQETFRSHHRDMSVQSRSNLCYRIAQYIYGSKCEDPRDKIFGIQSLLESEFRVAVDYGSSTHRVYLAAMETWLKALHMQDNASSGIGHGFFICLLCARGMGIIDERENEFDALWALESEMRKSYDHLVPQERRDGKGVMFGLGQKWEAVKVVLHEHIGIANAVGETEDSDWELNMWMKHSLLASKNTRF